jgi:hypothetical protein
MTLLTIMLLADNAFACSCLGGGKPCEAYGSASAVFAGAVIAVRTADRKPTIEKDKIDLAPRTFKFSVEQEFLGVEGTDVEVATGTGGGDCGYEFKLGERHLVYAHRWGEGNRLITSICTRTQPYVKADEDLEFLRNLSSLAPGITIYGEVKRQRQNVAKGEVTPVGPLADAALIVAGESDLHDQGLR